MACRIVQYGGLESFWVELLTVGLWLALLDERDNMRKNIWFRAHWHKCEECFWQLTSKNPPATAPLSYETDKPMAKCGFYMIGLSISDVTERKKDLWLFG